MKRNCENTEGFCWNEAPDDPFTLARSDGLNCHRDAGTWSTRCGHRRRSRKAGQLLRDSTPGIIAAHTEPRRQDMDDRALWVWGSCRILSGINIL
jgi:hypothetical protein